MSAAFVDIAILATPERGGFQVFSASKDLERHRPWASTLALQGFDVANEPDDSDRSRWRLLLRREPHNYASFYIYYGVVNKAVGGRRGGCFGFAVFSNLGFVRDVELLRAEYFEAAIRWLIDKQLLSRGPSGRMHLNFSDLESCRKSLDHIIDWLGDELARVLQRGAIGRELNMPLPRRDVPELGLGSAPEVIEFALSRYGCVSFQEDAVSYGDVLAFRESSEGVSQAHASLSKSGSGNAKPPPAPQTALAGQLRSVLEGLQKSREEEVELAARRVKLGETLEALLSELLNSTMIDGGGTQEAPESAPPAVSGSERRPVSNAASDPPSDQDVPRQPVDNRIRSIVVASVLIAVVVVAMVAALFR